MLEHLTLATMSEQVNTTFRVRLGESEAVEVTLIEAMDLGSTSRQEQFSVIFRGPADRFLPQQIHRMEHDRLGAFDLFLVPIGREQTGFKYEAVFNRLVGGQA